MFVDTPGVHKPSSQLDRRMMQEVHEALEQRDVVLVMVDATRELRLPEDAASDKAKHDRASSEDVFALELIRKLDCPVFLVLTKIDLVARDIAPADYEADALHNFAEVIPVSARKSDGLDLLIADLVKRCRRGTLLSEGSVHRSAERFMVAELIRERILVETGEEVPYAAAVVIERFRGATGQREAAQGRQTAA